MSELSFNLDDKVAVVTGGSRGIGLEITKMMLAQNARVVICGRKQEGLDAAKEQVGEGGDRFLALQAHIAKEEFLILWTDYFKPAHLEQYPDLHDTFWQAAKLCSAVKVEVSLEKAEALMETCKKVHDIFWATKGVKVEYYTAS